MSREILLGVTGSIAAYKACELARAIVKNGDDLTVAMTAAATKLVAPATFRALTGRRPVTDLFDDWVAHPMEHISISRDVDAAVIAPATANFLGKLAGGIADDALTTIVISCTCPIVIAPAMNERMYVNPAVLRNIEILREMGYTIVGPVEGDLACGTGMGRMSPVEEILERLQDGAGAPPGE